MGRGTARKPRSPPLATPTRASMGVPLSDFDSTGPSPESQPSPVPHCAKCGGPSPVSDREWCDRCEAIDLGEDLGRQHPVPKAVQPPSAPLTVSIDPLAAWRTSERCHSLQALSLPISLDIKTEAQPAVLFPFFRCGDLGLLTGLAGCGKTTFASDLILAMILPRSLQGAGKSIAGLFRADELWSRSGRVAIIDAEGSQEEWAIRLRRTVISRGLDPDLPEIQDHILTRLHYFDAFDLGLSNPQTWPDACRETILLLDSLHCRFVVMDSLASVWCPPSVNEQEWIVRAMIPWRDQGRRMDVTSLILAHTARPSKDRPSSSTGMPLGSSRQEANADVVLSLSQSKTGCKLTVNKQRRAWWIAKGVSAELTWGDRGAGFVGTVGGSSWSDWPPGTIPPALSIHYVAILETLMRARSPLTQEALTERSGVNRPEVSRALALFLIPKRLVDQVGGSGHTGSPFVYVATDAGKAALTYHRKIEPEEKKKS